MVCSKAMPHVKRTEHLRTGRLEHERPARARPLEHVEQPQAAGTAVLVPPRPAPDPGPVLRPQATTASPSAPRSAAPAHVAQPNSVTSTEPEPQVSSPPNRS